MAHEFLSIKLYEVDKQIARIHHRIQSSETLSLLKLREEIDALAKECEENESIVRGSLRRSKARLPGDLLGVFSKIEAVIHQSGDAIQSAPMDREDELDQRLLMAEYELDFAMLAVNRALLVSLEAIERQLAYQTKEESIHA